jgi:hypothetical protein
MITPGLEKSLRFDNLQGYRDRETDIPVKDIA